MQIFDAKSKFFNTSGNWLLVAFAQDPVIGCLLAVNHWDNEVKIYLHTKILLVLKGLK